MATIADLKDKVAALQTVEDSVVALIQGLAQQVRDLKPNQADIDALAASLDSQAQTLTDAVTQNTNP